MCNSLEADGTDMELGADDVRERIHEAVRRLVAEEPELFAIDVNERSLTHRLAVYVESLFPEWDVDCEYNRNDADPKRIGDLRRRIEESGADQSFAEDTLGRTVYPDIIVHRRRSKNNLLAVEVKKDTNRSVKDDIDFDKLQAYLADPELQYKHACFIRLRMSNPSPDAFGCVCFMDREGNCT